jgi:putative endonuclease
MLLKNGYVYILTNRKRTVLYTGVTSDLIRRVTQHREKKYPKSFTARYNVHILLHYEFFPYILEAIQREHYIKGKLRQYKVDLINSSNPQWRDLFEQAKDECY